MNKIKCKDINPPAGVPWLFDLSVTIPDMEEPYNVFNGNMFRNIMKYKYGEFYFLTQSNTQGAIFQDFIYAFESYFNDLKKKSIAMQIYALLQTYNPIENYDKISEITTEFKGEKSVKTTYDNVKDKLSFVGEETSSLEKSGKEKSTNEKTGQEKTDFNNAQLTKTNETSQAPMTSNTYSNLNKNEEKTLAHNDTQTTTYGTSDNPLTDTNTIEYGADNTQRKDVSKTSFTGRYNENEKSGSETSIEKYGTNSDPRKDVVSEHTHGNIGVTTSAQMVSEVLQVYNVNFVESLLDGFFNHYCYLFDVRD